jgi:uncharacterized membrane protein YoaK (UPF0700 family)
MATTGADRRSSPSWLADYIAHPKHGPLPALLLGLTISTGMVDAVCILALGRVFVANMTGTIAFIGFGLAGAPGFSLQASLVALAAFLVGAAIGGVVASHFHDRRGVLLRNGVALELLLLVIAAFVLGLTIHRHSSLWQDTTVAFTGIALGVQNAVVRKLAVPDLTSTVLTTTLTGFAADLHNRDFRVATRRGLAVLALTLGAAVGALLVLHVNATVALAVPCALVAAVLLGVTVANRRPAPWQTP